ncbi:hypothetical protein MTP99_000152 [Tenebrio molitor]|nr:hypothetical protein MTP99_000152 [Tenebrio molitor]
MNEWADYFVKFLDSYQSEGIEFWGITTGNEPNLVMAPLNQINTVGWNSTQMAKWNLNNLGPSIRNSNHSDINIMILDDQRMFLPWFLDEATPLADTSTELPSTGTRMSSFPPVYRHSRQLPREVYFSSLSPIDGATGSSGNLSTSLSNVARLPAHPKFVWVFNANCDGTITYNDPILILGSEACNGIDFSVGPVDVSSWVGAWINWNMELDLGGGPIFIDNFVDSPVIINATGDEFYKQPMFHHLGHFPNLYRRVL